MMEPLMLTIGRLGTQAGFEPKTLRYYDRVGLLRPSRRSPAGYRLYDRDAVDRLDFIRRGKTLGMSLADIRRILVVRDEGAAPCRHVLELVTQNLQHVEKQMRELGQLRSDLHRLRRLLKERMPTVPRSAEGCMCFEIIRSFTKPKANGSFARPVRIRKGSRG